MAGFSATNTFAGQLNEYEQAFLSKASEGYYYQDRHFYVAEQYMNNARAKFMEDDYDLSKDDYDKIISSMYDYVQQGILEGYLLPSDGQPVDMDAIRGIVREEEDPNAEVLEELKEKYRKELEEGDVTPDGKPVKDKDKKKNKKSGEDGNTSSGNGTGSNDGSTGTGGTGSNGAGTGNGAESNNPNVTETTQVELQNAIDRAEQAKTEGDNGNSTESFIILEGQKDFSTLQNAESGLDSGYSSTTTVDSSDVSNIDNNGNEAENSQSVVKIEDENDDYLTVSFPESQTVKTIWVIIVSVACLVVVAFAILLVIKLRPRILSDRVKHVHGPARKILGALGSALTGIFVYALMLMLSVLMGFYSDSSINSAFIESGYYTKMQDELLGQAKAYAIDKDIDTEVLDEVFSIKQISVDGDNYVRAAEKRSKFIFNKKALSEKLLDEILKSKGDLKSVTLNEFADAQVYADELAQMYCDYVTNTFIADHFMFGDRFSGNVKLVIAINVTLIICLMIVMYLTQRYAHRVVKYAAYGLLAAGVVFFFVCGIFGMPDFLSQYKTLYTYGFIADLIIVLVKSYKIVGIVLGIGSSVLASVMYHGAKLIKKSTDFGHSIVEKHSKKEE